MSNSVQHIRIGHWSKDGEITEGHCHFTEEEDASNAFCFEEEKGKRVPTALIGHIVQHFSYEGQWVLDLTFSKGNFTLCLKKYRNVQLHILVI